MVKEWDVEKIGNLFEFKNGLNKSKDFFGQGTPIINYMDVYKKRGLRRKDIKGLVSLESAEIKRYEAKKNDVFFTRTSETPEEVGFSSVLLEDIPNCVYSGFVLRGRPLTQRLVPEYCQYCFFAPNVRREIILNCTCTTRALTNGTQLSRIEIPVPDEPEQKQITKALSDIDNLINWLEKEIQKLKDLKIAYLSELFPHNGEPHPVTRVEGCSDDWKMMKLGDCLAERVERSSEGELLSVTINDGIKRFSELGRYDKSSQNKANYKVVVEGDIVYNTMRMWQGASGYSPYCGIVSPAYTVLVAKDGYSSAFFAYAFKQPEMINKFLVFSQGMTSDTWNLKYPLLADIEIQVPEIDEQRKIVEQLSTIDSLTMLNQDKLEKYRKIKTGMMNELLTGKIRLV